MRTVVGVFLAFLTKSIEGSLTYKELSVRKLFIFIQKSCFQNLRLLEWEMRELWIIRNKTRWPRLASGIEHVPECKKDKERRWERRYPHSTVILKKYFENITLKSCNIAKIFIKLVERFLKYCRNLAMSVQNIINGIFLQY